MPQANPIMAIIRLNAWKEHSPSIFCTQKLDSCGYLQA
ncbi:unnamed protein product [Penicillium camemberti]|uniref:Str. FM013 n=1 Tax=Penicillium camemberti (strain FM 013) TaxID=1429867 RepID=A0A0G4PVD1_PENC3|nr:unnamed protein product [Penicillium camemberti]